MTGNRCPSVYGGGVTLLGHAIRCELETGHTGEHGHSYAARYWGDDGEPETGNRCPVRHCYNGADCTLPGHPELAARQREGQEPHGLSVPSDAGPNICAICGEYAGDSRHAAEYYGGQEPEALEGAYVHITAYMGGGELGLTAGVGHVVPSVTRPIQTAETYRTGDARIGQRVAGNWGRWAVDDAGPYAPSDAADGEYIGADGEPLELGELELSSPYRIVTVAAYLTRAELAELRSEWALETGDAEPALGWLGVLPEPLGDGLPRLYPDERHTLDGEGWGTNWGSPVLWVDVSIVGPDAVPAGSGELEWVGEWE